MNLTWNAEEEQFEIFCSPVLKMDGSDSEALEQLRDLYTPVDHKTFAAAN